MRSKGDAAELERRRWLAMERLQQGFSTRQVADFFGVDIRSVQRWKATYDKKGKAALAAKPALGRMPKLTDRQIRTVLSWFLRSPMEFGFSTNLWTSKRVARLIQREFGVTYHSNYLCRWLTDRNITPQKPIRRAKQRDENRIQDWVNNVWPDLVKKGIETMPIS